MRRLLLVGTAVLGFTIAAFTTVSVSVTAPMTAVHAGGPLWPAYSGLVLAAAIELGGFVQLLGAAAEAPTPHVKEEETAHDADRRRIVIKRPVDEVFDFVADERNEPQYNPRMSRAEKVSAGPIGLGTRFRAETTTVRRRAEMTIEITAYDRPRLLASSTHLSSMDIQGTLAFDPVPGGTRVRWLWNLEPRGLLEVMRPLIAGMGQRQERTIWANLKRFLEMREGS
jgi:uncharacterized membrane protein